MKKEKRPNFRRKLRRGFKKILFRKENFKKKEKEKIMTMKVKKMDLNRRGRKILQLSLNTSRNFAKHVLSSLQFTEKCKVRNQKIDKISLTFKSILNEVRDGRGQNPPPV